MSERPAEHCWMSDFPVLGPNQVSSTQASPFREHASQLEYENALLDTLPQISHACPRSAVQPSISLLLSNCSPF